MKEVIIRTIFTSPSQNGMLDPEYCEMLIKHRMWQITRSEFDAFALVKAKHTSEQENRPQCFEVAVRDTRGAPLPDLKSI